MGTLIYKKWLTTAESQGSRIAYLEPQGAQVTFSELQERVEQCLQGFTNRARWRNRIIAFQMENSTEWLIAFLTCQALEAIALPFDPDMPRDGIKEILEVLRPAAFWNHQNIEALKNSTKRAPACLIKLTSGSTGRPKPLFFEDCHVQADGNQISQTMGIETSDTNLALIPFGHSYGLGNLIMPLIQLGVPLAVCRDPFPHTIADAVEQTGATIIPTVPAILKALAHSAINPRKFSRVRLWLSAGSPLHPNDAQYFFEKLGNRIHNFYGSSETGGIAYDRKGEDTLSGRSVGTPLKGVRVCLSPSNRLQVYSKAVFTRRNRLRSAKLRGHLLADEADLLSDGSIQLKGRRGRIAKLGGKRVILSEIERQLLHIKSINEVRVTEYTNPAGRTRLAAAIAPIQDSSQIKKALKAYLPPWKIPDRWLTMENFPLSNRGKIKYSEIERRLRR